MGPLVTTMPPQAMEDTDLRGIAANLVPLEDGLWVARAAGGQAISYPDGGHAECYALEDRSAWFAHRNRCIVEAVRRHPPGGAIFDIGGGNGYVALGLRAAGFDAVLVEPGIDGARRGVGRGLAPVVCATVEDAGFAPGSLPAVGLFDVLEHIEDDAGFLRALHRLLAADGRLYLTVPAYAFLWSDEDVEAGHFRRYRLGQLRRLLERTGFVLELGSYFFSPLPLPILVTRALRSRLGVRRAQTSASHEQEHAGRGWAVLQRVLDLELAQLRKGRTLPVGSSSLAVARRAGSAT
jgi:SAM-dependent methyltransferase